MRLVTAHIIVMLLISFTSVASTKPINVMGPLWLQTESEWQAFENQLQIIKSTGVTAISIDVWWGIAERDNDQKFDWSYYDKIFNIILQHELNIVPIMSFHQCGGNVGDTCNIPLPKWIWEHFNGIPPNDLMYKSEQGNYSKEYISLWADDLVLPQYQEFMEAFANHFKGIADRFEEINISMGPAGELRYPSYNNHDSGTNYPSRGAFQSYGQRAALDFQQFLTARYGQVTDLNRQWQSEFTAISEITLPQDMEQFIVSGKLSRSNMGRDLLTWYHQSLVAHGDRKLALAHRVFDGDYKAVEIGFKVAGLHWLMASPAPYTRVAELAAGVISIEQVLSGDTALGYENVLNLAVKYSAPSRSTVFHFTCLEMSNGTSEPAYSLARELVETMGREAHKRSVIIKGENALAAGILSKVGWDNIESALADHHYSGLTVLRLNYATETLPLARLKSLN